MWANDILRQKQSFPPWPPGTIVTDEVLAQYADWKQVANDYELPVILSEIQDAKWEEIKASRESAINSPIEYLGALFDFDEKGQKNLSDAVIAAQSAKTLNVPFPDVEWTLYNNTTKTLTQAELLAFPLQAGIVRKGILHAKARVYREEIYKTDATIESVKLVKWEA
jgi:hypothetical protein